MLLASLLAVCSLLPVLLAQPATPSLTRDCAVLLTSNSLPSTRAAIVDGNDTTAWQSGASFPTGFVSRPELNVLYSLCSSQPAACTATAGSKTLAGATDNNTTSAAASIAVAAGQGASLRLQLPGGPLPLRRVVLRPIVGASALLTVSLQTSAGSSIQVASLNSSASYSWVGVVGPWEDVVAIQLASAAAFTVTELGATSVANWEQATVDLGSVQQLGTIRVRHWAGSAGLNTTLLTSQDGVSFDIVSVLSPSQLSAVTINLPTPVAARFVAVRHIVKEEDWAKVYVWSIDAWGVSPSPPPSPAPPPPPPSPPPPLKPGEWNTRAGTVASMTLGKPVTVSTNDNKDVGNIVDGLENTQWQSDACFPTGYTVRDDMNPLRGACAAAGRCTASAGTTQLADATDQNVYTGAFVSLPAGTPTGQPSAFLQASLPAAATVKRVTVKGFGTALIDVMLIKADGTSVKAATLNPATQNYQWVNTDGVWEGVVAARVQSTAGFTLTELAVQTGSCTQWATVDMEEVKQVGMLRVRFWSMDAAETRLLISEDGQNWTTVRKFDPTTLPTVDVWLCGLTPIRYISIRHTITNTSDWRKVYVWTIEAYDQFGRWGPPPDPKAQTHTFRQLLGMNGIWGFGFQKFSDTSLKEGKGPLYYSKVASSGRNYHSMNWDVKWPNRDPHYDTMKTKGTDGQWWLDWDREYAAWEKGGLPVVASYQFTNDVFPPSTWGPDPYTTAYKLGKAFAAHFGPTNGTGTVKAVEFGNEPWDGYNATWYSEALRGWVDGAKAGDPALMRLPCALQASNPNGEGPGGGSFVGARISPSVGADLNGLNMHIYSFFRLDDGTRIYVQPEHPGSDFNGLNNMLAWRDNNMPGKPLWVTEWGWDAHLPGEPCNNTECVSQYAQAVYGVRGLMVLARKGVDLSHWFFYANDDNCNTLFCRSGLRGSNSTGFPELPVYRSLGGLMELAGDNVFLGVLSESASIYAYMLGSPGSLQPTHIIAWRPLEVVDEGPEPAVATRLSLGAAVVMGAQPLQAWVIDGQGATGYHEAAALPQLTSDGTSWLLSISSAALLVKLR